METPPRRRLSAAERRKELLDAAVDVFARDGYHRASLEDIAGAAGVSKALIYEHFSSKRELHDELVLAYAGEIFECLQASAGTPGLPGQERLRRGVEAFLGFVEDHREAWRALFRDAADPEVSDQISVVQSQATLVIATLIRADAEGRPRDRVDPGYQEQVFAIYAQVLAGGLQLLANWWYDHQEVTRAEVVDRAMEFCWLGLERVSEGAYYAHGVARG